MSTQTDTPEDAARGRWSTTPQRIALIATITVAVVSVPTAGITWWLAPEAADAVNEEPEEGEILTLEPMTVGLSGGAGHARVGVGLVLADGVDPDDLEARLPLMKDAALERVAGLGRSELSSPEGMSRLRSELASDAAAIFDGDDEPVVVRAILTELVVQ